MQKFERFYFEKYEFDNKTLKAKFYYNFDQKVCFVEEIDFSSDFLSLRSDFDINILNNFLFSLSLALWISYYKLYPTKDLVLNSWFLDEENILFWQKFYKNWLWEFLYKNNINPEWLFNFVNASEKKYKKIDFYVEEKIFLPIWWGKDSIVSAEVLLKNDFDFTPIIFWKIDEIKQNCLIIMWKKEILIKRKLDENLFKLNEKGYYNWHVPITWIIAFAMITASYLYNHRYIIISNEKSANTWNTTIPCHSRECGNLIKWQKSFLEVNHQYSKSLEFEQDLSRYIEKNLSSDLKYFSLLRGLYEIKIAEIFSKIWKKYFWVFSSCNKNFKIRMQNTECRMQRENTTQTLCTEPYILSTSYWCNSCPKCAFVYSILRPFITDNETLEIFSKELYEDNSLENLFLELLWIQWIKPFECVWEKEEVAYAMNETIKKFREEKKEIPYILKIFEKKIASKYDENFSKKEKEKLFKNYNEETLIPDKFMKIEF